MMKLTVLLLILCISSLLHTSWWDNHWGLCSCALLNYFVFSNCCFLQLLRRKTGCCLFRVICGITFINILVLLFLTRMRRVNSLARIGRVIDHVNALHKVVHYVSVREL